MFQFGLFATHLPYLIITAAYMIYFGTCAFQGGEEPEMDMELNEKHIVQSFEQIEKCSSIAFYDVIVGQFTDKANIKISNHYTEKVKEIFHLFEEPLYDKFQGSTVLSRPPPSC